MNIVIETSANAQRTAELRVVRTQQPSCAADSHAPDQDYLLRMVNSLLLATQRTPAPSVTMVMTASV